MAGFLLFKCSLIIQQEWRTVADTSDTDSVHTLQSLMLSLLGNLW